MTFFSETSLDDLCHLTVDLDFISVVRLFIASPDKNFVRKAR